MARTKATNVKSATKRATARSSAVDTEVTGEQFERDVESQRTPNGLLPGEVHKVGSIVYVLNFYKSEGVTYPTSLYKPEVFPALVKRVQIVEIKIEEENIGNTSREVTYTLAPVTLALQSTSLPVMLTRQSSIMATSYYDSNAFKEALINASDDTPSGCIQKREDCVFATADLAFRFVLATDEVTITT